MLFAERDFEMALLRNLYSKSEQGKAQTVLVEAPVACGKTALLHRFAEQAEETGAVVLTATGSRAEQTHPFGLISQVLHHQELQPALGGDAYALLAQAPAPAEGPDPVTMQQTTAQLARALCGALLELTAQRHVVLSIDDIQHADESTLQILLFLLRRLRSERLLVLLSECQVSPPAHPTFRAELLRQPNSHRIQLLPLTVAGITEVLAEYVDELTAARLAPAYSEVSGGNPLLLSGLIEDAMVQQPGGGRTLAARPVAKESFQQAVFACLYRWDESTIEVARGLALLGGHASPSLIGQVTGMKSAQVEQIMGVLTHSRFQRGGRLRHPAVNAAVLNTLPLDDSGRMHLHAARLLHDCGADPLSVAEHLITAGNAPDTWAVPVLQDACAQALSEERVDLAVECLELARCSCDDDPQRAALVTLSLARLKWRRDPSAAACHLTPLKEALVAGLLQDRDAITVARYLLWHSRVENAQELLARLESVVDTSDPSTAADLGSLEDLQHWLRLDPVPAGRDGAGTPAAISLFVAQPAELTTSSVLASALRDGPDGAAVHWAESVLSSISLGDTTIGTVQFGLSLLLHAGRLDRATAACLGFLAEARASGANTWQALLTAIHAEIALRQGDLPAAEERAVQALGLISAHGWGVAIGYPLAVQLLAQTAMSKHEDASRVVRRAVPKAMFQGLYGLKYLHARGHHYLATNRLQAALSDFRRCGDLARDWTLDLPALVPWRSDLAQVQLGMDRPEAAHGMVVEQLSLPGADSPRTRGISLRVLAATECLKQRPGLLREAIGLLQESGDRCELALTRAQLSRAHHELGEFNRARMMGQLAMQVAEDCGMETLCRQVLYPSDGAPRPDGAPTDAVDTLSDAERRVAALAATEHTNREIARKLYITTSTVEQHLTRVYRKLNVKRRSDLPLRLRDREPLVADNAVGRSKGALPPESVAS
ncbi:AAA family ATPase [Streptomyces sp. NPDC056149]|uniref:AAA family ATPase n=1 Tax=Streptomyces sp. NPDC056149 TaxID=3345728 RepID=UPI0035DCB6FE